MSTITEEAYQNKDTYIELSQAQMDKWRDGLDKLGEEIKKYPDEVQSVYYRDLGKLNSDWESVESAFTEMENADPEQWEQARYDWGKSAANFWQSFTQLSTRISKEHEVPLGWAQGMTDHRTMESAGWAEGFGQRPLSSEGWAEGMGHQGHSSRGWAEGYDE